ncbi:MAG TPA: chemotaxis protein CheC, partial [Ruminococcaceae bacterium]|nr:chemotaxis protein CheC [Oscillospiraceae bacterium]
SKLLSQTVDITVPSVRILSFEETINALGGPEVVSVGILANMSGDVSGMIMFILEQSFAHIALNILMGKNVTSYEELTEMDYSAIAEIGNIMAGSYVSAISSLTNFFINISVPSVCIDMLGALMSVPAIEYSKIGDKVLLIEGSFLGEGQTVTSRTLLIPEMESLNKILTCLGIPV